MYQYYSEAQKQGSQTGISIQTGTLFPKKQSEDMEHIFISCAVIQNIWGKAEITIKWKNNNSNLASLFKKI